jgi:hypothetical protein
MSCEPVQISHSFFVQYTPCRGCLPALLFDVAVLTLPVLVMNLRNLIGLCAHTTYKLERMKVSTFLE